MWSIYKHVTFIRIKFSQHNKQKINNYSSVTKKLKFILPRSFANLAIYHKFQHSKSSIIIELV